MKDNFTDNNENFTVTTSLNEEETELVTEDVNTPEVSEPDGADAPHDEFSEDEFLFRESDIDEKIEIPSVVSEDVKSGKRGLAVFAVIVAVAVLLSGVFAGGYFLGKSGKEDNPIAAKPSGELADSAAVYSAVEKSIAGICVYNASGARYIVSGIVYSADGYIVTTDSLYTFITNPSFIVMVDGKHYTASFVGGDQNSDVTVLKINESVNLTPAQLGDSDRLVAGEATFALGKSNGYEKAALIYEGIVTAPSVRVKNAITDRSNRVVQTTNPANKGDFGGALVNAHGQVIGMLSTKIVATGYESITYSTPSVTLKKVADQIIKNGKVTDRVRMGITYTVVDYLTAKTEGFETVGIKIESVDRESELYELLKKDDIITHINDIEAVSDEILLDVIDNSKPGDSITVTVLSPDKKSRNHTVKLLNYDSTSSYNLPILNNSPDSSEDNYEGF